MVVRNISFGSSVALCEQCPFPLDSDSIDPFVFDRPAEPIELLSRKRARSSLEHGNGDKSNEHDLETNSKRQRLSLSPPPPAATTTSPVAPITTTTTTTKTIATSSTNGDLDEFDDLDEFLDDEDDSSSAPTATGTVVSDEDIALLLAQEDADNGAPPPSQQQQQQPSKDTMALEQSSSSTIAVAPSVTTASLSTSDDQEELELLAEIELETNNDDEISDANVDEVEENDDEEARLLASDDLLLTSELDDRVAAPLANRAAAPASPPPRVLFSASPPPSSTSPPPLARANVDANDGIEASWDDMALEEAFRMRHWLERPLQAIDRSMVLGRCTATTLVESSSGGATNPSVTVASVATLLPGNWLNDEIVNLYMFFLTRRHPHAECLSSFFTARLLGDNGLAAVSAWPSVQRAVERLRSKKLELLLIPIHLESARHWILASVSLESDRVTCSVFDSLASCTDLTATAAETTDETTTTTFAPYHRALSTWLEQEFVQHRSGTSGTATEASTPHWHFPITKAHQDLSHDLSNCGVYTCLYAEQLCNGYAPQTIASGGVGLMSIDQYRDKILARLIRCVPLSVPNDSHTVDRFVETLIANQRQVDSTLEYSIQRCEPASLDGGQVGGTGSDSASSSSHQASDQSRVAATHDSSTSVGSSNNDTNQQRASADGADDDDVNWVELLNESSADHDPDDTNLLLGQDDTDLGGGDDADDQVLDELLGSFHE